MKLAIALLSGQLLAENKYHNFGQATSLSFDSNLENIDQNSNENNGNELELEPHHGGHHHLIDPHDSYKINQRFRRQAGNRLDMRNIDGQDLARIERVAADEHILNLVVSSVDELLQSQIGVDASTFKNLGLSVGPAIGNIENYGCWCYFEESHGHGRGNPVDAVDGHCKTLHQAYDCAMMDYKQETGQNDCIPWEVDYNSGISQGLDSIVHTCRQVNSELCAQYACMAESVFVIKMIRTFLAYGQVHPQNQIKNGFDFKNECNLGKSANGSNERECCGELPYRYPFRVTDGRSCCGVSTYDPSLMECCDDSVARFSC